MSADREPYLPAAADALARAASAARPPHPDYTLLDVKHSPVPLKLTWARDAVYPAAICLRKDLRMLGLVKFTAKADLTLPDARLICGFSCKDTLFHGRFSLNAPARMVEYRKKFQLPNGTGLSVAAGLQHVGARDGGWGFTSGSLRDRFRPLLSAQLTFGAGPGGDVVMTGDGFSCKQRLPVPQRWTGLAYPRLELETYTNIKVPQLTTRYSLQRDGARGGVPDGVADPWRQEQEPLHLHVAAANLVIRL